MDTEDLALVCATLGGLQRDDNQIEVYAKSPNCLENLKDLQRYLRRDNPTTRDVFMQLGKWNTVRQDLVPIIKHYQNDSELVLSCVKVLVFLTMPVNPLSNQVSLQVEYLQQFKAAIVEGDPIADIMAHLEDSVERLESGSPKEEDWKLLQLYLTLLRNLLSIPDYVPRYGSAPQMLNSQYDLLELLLKEDVLDLVVALTPHVAESGGLRKDNLLLLEIIHYMFKGQQPDLVARASDRDTKGEKHSRKTSANLRSKLEAEKEGLKRLRNRDAAYRSPYSGVYVRVARDGSKTIFSRNPHQSPLDNLIRKPQIHKGRIKRVASDAQPVVYTPDRIYVLLRDFAVKFLALPYNILMQSIKEDIRRERARFETREIILFFEVAQFFTSYQCCLARKTQSNSGEVSACGDGPEGTAQKHLCDGISATMDEDMFTMVILKWHEFAELAKELPAKDLATAENWGHVVAAGRTMKDMICMLDLVLKRSGPLTKESEQEVRTARILLYKILYDQTDEGILHFVKTLIKTFDIYKQPQSYLADLVEITHIVLRILEGFAKAGISLRVLKKVRGGRKKKKTEDTPPGHPPSEGVGAHSKSLSDAERSVGASVNASDSPGCAGDEIPSVEDGENTADASMTAATNPHEQCGLNVEAEVIKMFPVDQDKNSDTEIMEGSPPADEEYGAKDVHVSQAEDHDDETSEDDAREMTKEESLDIGKTLGMFADNVVVRNYCWLLKFYSTNRATINHYIVRMLQRICEDQVHEPMMYQVSILLTFYNILSNPGAGDHRFVVSFLSKVVRRLFKKLKAQPMVYVELLFWKNRTECHNITTDYMLHSLRKATGGSSQSRKRINIADALGDDEDARPTVGPDRDNEGSTSEEDDAEVLSDNDGEDPATTDDTNLFSEAQEEQIKELFERYKNDPDKSRVIASELDSSGAYTSAQVTRKLRELGLEQLPLKKPGQSVSKKLKRSIRSSGGDDGASKRRRLSSQVQDEEQSDVFSRHEQSNEFSEADDKELMDLFNRHGTDDNVSDVIAQSLGGTFTSAQVSGRLRALGLVKSNEKLPPPKSRNKSSRSAEKTGSKRSRIFSEANDRKLIELFGSHGNGKNVSKVIAEGLGGAFKPAQVSRRLRALGLVKPKPRSAQFALHANLTDSDDEDDKDDKGPSTLRDSSQEEGNAGGDVKIVKLRRKSNRVDLSDSEDDVSNDRLRRKTSSQDRELPDNAAEHSRGTNVDDSDDDDVPLSVALKKREDPSDSIQTHGTELWTSGDKADCTSGANRMGDVMGAGRHASAHEGSVFDTPSGLGQQADYVDEGNEGLNGSQLPELPSPPYNARKRLLSKGRRVESSNEAIVDTQDAAVSTKTYEDDVQDSDFTIGSRLQPLTNRRIVRKTPVDVVDTFLEEEEGLNDF